MPGPPRPLDPGTAQALLAEQPARMASGLELPQVFSAEECQRIVDLQTVLGHRPARSVDRKQPAHGQDRNLTYDPERRLTDLTVIPSDHAWIYQRVGRAVSQANERAWHFELSFLEPLQLLGYPVGGHIEWHTDLGDRGLASFRKVSATVLLSDPAEYDGGDLELLTAGRVIVTGKEQGKGVFFPSFQNHHVTPVTRGKRFALIVWTLGKRSFT